MEKMPFNAELESNVAVEIVQTPTSFVSSDWRTGLPMLIGRGVTLRDLRKSDAASLLAMLTTEEVSRFISPPPTTIQGFEKFIAWAHRERSNGSYACFAVVPDGYDTAVGIFQVRQLEPSFRTAEWGFAIGSAFWGTGAFTESATQVLAFCFDTVGIHRLEARASVQNGRGNGALRKIGAVPEGLLRKSFLRRGEYLDQMLYSIVESDWREMREERSVSTFVH
jgi:RimJ/RimL family protein N-acetyltransferase